VSTPGVARRIHGQPGTLDPCGEVGRVKGLWEVKGDPIPWVVHIVGNRMEPGI
jgi:hypothetical protein